MKQLILADEPELICTSAHHEPQVICEECREDYHNAIPITPEMLAERIEHAMSARLMEHGIFIWTHITPADIAAALEKMGVEP